MKQFDFVNAFICSVIRVASARPLLRLTLFAGVAASGAYGQCTYTLSPAAPFVDSAAQSGIVIQVTASDTACAWTANSNSFATAGSPGATGNGSVQYTVTANNTGVDRTATVTVAGTPVVITQRWTKALFSDVLPSINYFNAANLMSEDGITVGCATQPTLQYCGEQNVTRRQMAVFIVRTIFGGGAAGNNFNYSTTPYFTDVPATDANFKYVQKLRELGVTAGCTATTYCPDTNVTRDQMAVFIVRARLGATAAYTFNPTPYFTDVPANYQPANFYKAIQKLKEIGITAGCTVTAYCPTAFVTRGAMAIFLERAGFNELFSGSTPLLSSVSPNSGVAGSSVTVTLTGVNTNFAQGSTTVTSNNGVTAGTPTVTDATHLSVQLTIPQNTVLGPISLTAATGTEQATIPNGFNVGLGDPLPTITSFTPSSGPIGTAVTITGTGLVSSAGTPADVRIALQGGGIGSAPVTASSATSLSFVVPSTATTGNITVAGSSGSATSATAFTVTPSSTFTITAGPGTANLIAGQQATYTVTIASTNGFTGVAKLSLTGVPNGVTAVFKPAQITVGQQSLLTLTAPSNQASSTSTLVISGAGAVDGLPLLLSTSVTLNVTPITTSFLGRTTVDNTAETSLVGVVVTMLGKDGAGANTGCTGSTISDESGNFALTGLSANCIGPQLIGFGGDNVISPAGTYAGVNLVFTLVSGQVVVSPVLVHLPRIDNVETFLVKQNSNVDQSYVYKSIPGLSITVYAGTVFTKADGTQPDPFPLAAIEVAVDRLPDVMPVTTATVSAFIVAFQPANTVASKGVAVWFPNTLNTPPGTNVPLATLDPTRGRMVPYGTGTISNDGTTIIPDVDPASGALNHRFGIVHFDWHGPAVIPPPTVNPPCTSNPVCGGDPVDLSTGLQVTTSQDLVLKGNRGSIAITRTYRTLSNQPRAFGIGSSFNYDYRLDTLTPQSVAVVNLELPNGTRVPFSRQADGTLTNLTAPPMSGAVMTTAGDGSATLRFKTGAYYSFVPGTFLTGSVVTAIGDPNGNVIKIVRDPSTPQQITEIDDPVGRKLVFTWDVNSYITSIKDPIGRTVNYTYNSAGTLATFTDVLGGVTKYTYDSQNRLLTVTDPRGIVLAQNTYDSNGRVIAQVTPSGGTIHIAYTLVNSLVPTSPVLQTVVTDPLGNATTYRFSSQGYVVSATDATGQTRNFDLASGTNFVVGIHGGGVCAACGDTAGGDVTMTYDGNGNILTQTDALGNTTTFTYDSVFNNVTSITDPLGNITRRVYDGRGNLTKVTDPRGNSTLLSRDGNGLVTQVQDPVGNITRFTYDSVGNLVSAEDALGNKTQFTYDGVSRMVGQLDPLGRSSSIVYNPGDEATTLVDGNGNTIQFTYDVAGFLASFTDARAGKTTVAYDSTGRVSSRTDPLQRVKAYQYDIDNNVVGFTNRRGQKAVYAYDALNRVVTETYTDATVQRTYDSSDRLIRVVDSQAGTFNMAYDLAGRLVKSVGPNGSIVYARDANGRVTSRQVVGQSPATYTYDANGNLTGAALGTTSVTRSYDARNLLTANVRSNGVAGAYNFDAVGRILSISEQSSSNTLFSRAFTYDLAGQITGNVLDTGLPLATPTASGAFDAANQITAFGGTTYTSDADGNRLSEVSSTGATTYTWDARGRLQAISAPGGVVTSFVYDPGGQMIQKRVTSAGKDDLQRYVLDDALNIASVQQGDSSSLTSILDGRGPDDIIATIQGGSPVFPLVDQIGSEGALTDGSGAVVGREFYDPYGASTTTGSVGLFQFTGRPPVGSGIYYYRARFYDSARGRFLSEDPLGLFGGSDNLYGYGGNNPVLYVDPLGLAYFARRPLSGWPWLGSASDNPTDNRNHTAISHEQLFFEDNQSPSNMGFFGDSTLKTESNPTGYRREPEHYDDCIMRQAVKNVELGKYHLLGNNCQDWAGRVKDEYNRLINKSNSCPIP